MKIFTADRPFADLRVLASCSKTIVFRRHYIKREREREKERTMDGPLVGVLALQGAFEEHQKCLEALGCRTVQVSESYVWTLPSMNDLLYLRHFLYANLVLLQ